MDITTINGDGLKAFKRIIGDSQTPGAGTQTGSALQSPAIDPEMLTRFANESDGMSETDFRATTAALSEMASVMNRGLDFSVHAETNTLVVKVIDKQTNEVIKEIPGAEFLDFIGRMHDFLGLLFDGRA